MVRQRQFIRHTFRYGDVIIDVGGNVGHLSLLCSDVSRPKGRARLISEMARVLIISPHFPPVNAPDMQRVRMSLPYFPDFGWEPLVLAVDPARAERLLDPQLLETIPSSVPVHHASAFDAAWTRRFGISAIGLRGFPFFYQTGARLIAEHRPDLVYFSTTAFPLLALGRLWKARFDLPFVVDMQDPWVGDYYDKRPSLERPPKYAPAQRMHRMLESFTMRKVDGIVAVAESYHQTLRRRYPWIRPEMCHTIPFGASEKDFAVAGKIEWHNPFFRPGDGLLHGVYVGVLGRVMTDTCRAICAAFRRGLEIETDIFSQVRLHFIGTDYASAEGARATIRPLAVKAELEQFIFEQTSRVPYFSALRLLRDADFLLLPGSDNAQYTASKLYPYILARKPLLAIFRKESSVVTILGETRAGTVVTFGTHDAAEQIANKLQPAMAGFLRSLPFTPETDWKAFKPYFAPEMTRRQCELFDLVIKRHHRN